jgi:hypothetical protein
VFSINRHQPKSIGEENFVNFEIMAKFIEFIYHSEGSPAPYALVGTINIHTW